MSRTNDDGTWWDDIQPTEEELDEIEMEVEFDEYDPWNDGEWSEDE